MFWCSIFCQDWAVGELWSSLTSWKRMEERKSVEAFFSDALDYELFLVLRPKCLCQARGNGWKWTEMAVFIFWAERVISCSTRQKGTQRQGALWHLGLLLRGRSPLRFLRILRCVKIRTHDKYYPGTELVYFLMLLLSLKNLLIFSYTISICCLRPTPVKILL